MAIQIKLHVEMEDGKSYDTVADQRDLARYEIQPFAGDIKLHPHSGQRFLAFSALDRAGVLKNGRTTLGWEAFNKQCVEVSATPEVDDPDAPKEEEV